MDAGWLTAATALAVAVGGLAVWAARWVWKILMGTVRFLEDWKGEPERDGVPARPGVMARLHAVETNLGQVLAETSPNHGKSLRDMVHRTALDVADIKDEQVRVRAELTKLRGDDA